MDKLKQRLIDEFGGEPWWWDHFAECNDCEFGYDGGMDWCILVPVDWHRIGPVTLEYYERNKIFQQIYGPAIEQQLSQEAAVFKRFANG